MIGQEKRKSSGHAPFPMTRASMAGALMLIISAICVTMVRASAAYPGPVVETQPDGTEVFLFIRGDEHNNWHEDVHGFPVVAEVVPTIALASGGSDEGAPGTQRPPSRKFVYALQGPEGELVPTEYEVCLDVSVWVHRLGARV